MVVEVNEGSGKTSVDHLARCPECRRRLDIHLGVVDEIEAKVDAHPHSDDTPAIRGAVISLNLDRLRERIEKAGGYAAVARITGIRARTIATWAKGLNGPSALELARLCNALGIWMEDLFDGLSIEPDGCRVCGLHHDHGWSEDRPRVLVTCRGCGRQYTATCPPLVSSGDVL